MQSDASEQYVLCEKAIAELQSVTYYMGSQCYLPPDTGKRA